MFFDAPQNTTSRLIWAFLLLPHAKQLGLFLSHYAVLRFTGKPNHGPNGGVPKKQPHRPLPLTHTNEQTTPFSVKKNSFLFLRTALAHLPAPVDYVRPTQTHKPTRPSNKPKIDPTPGNPQTNDVTKPRPHMTPRSRSICARRPVFSFFLWPFSHKITFLFLGTELARLPVLVGFFQPIHTHTLSQLQNKVGIKPTPGNPPEHDVTKLHLHMTPHPFLHTHV